MIVIDYCLCELDEEGSGPEDETGEELAKKRKWLPFLLCHLIIFAHVIADSGKHCCCWPL